MNIYLQKLFYFYTRLFGTNFGLIEKKITEKDWIFGASKIQKDIIRVDGLWDKDLPEDERQSNVIFDSMGCVSFSLLNAIEILIFAKYGIIVNLSDRLLAKGSGTTRKGNDMNTVADALKDKGIVLESEWKWNELTFDWDKFYAEIPTNIQNKALSWLDEWLFEYETIPISNNSVLLEALKYSPLWVSGYAWYQYGGKYYSYGYPNHAFVLIGGKKNEYLLAYDSYAPFIKKLAWNYRFGTVKQIAITQINLQAKIDKFLKAWDTKLIVNKDNWEEFYRVYAGKLQKIDNLKMVLHYLIRSQGGAVVDSNWIKNLPIEEIK